jgi:hypothetical protein
MWFVEKGLSFSTPVAPDYWMEVPEIRVEEVKNDE